MAAKIRRIVEPTSIEAIGRRLFITRKALGYTQATMAHRLRIVQSAWGMYENGTRRPGVDLALRMCALFGCSTDWIYRGRLEGLTEDFAGRLAAVDIEED